MASAESERSSYYQRAFGSIVSSVLDVYAGILSGDERRVLEQLNNDLAADAQRLFIRLYLRKSGWIRQDKLTYDDIKGIDAALEELIAKELVFLNSESIFDYVELLTLPELKKIIGRLQAKLPLSATRSVLETVVFEAKEPKQRTISFSSATGQMMSSMQAASKRSILAAATGPIVKLKEDIRSVCDTAMSLYFLVSSSVNGVEDNLSTAILVETNRRSYPKYRIARSGPLFNSRSDYDAYQAALKEEAELSESTVSLDTNHLSSLVAKFTESVVDESSMQRSYFLRRFTSGWVYCRTLEHLAERLESQKDYERAVELYGLLLSQTKFGLGHRGRWWERLVIDLSRHLKRADAALAACELSLQDEAVRTAFLTALKRRLCRLQQQLTMESDASVQSEDFEQITLYGRILKESPMTGRKLLFHLNDDDLAVGSVEEFVLEEFRNDPSVSWDGLHSESSCFTTLFGLLFWDLLFGGDCEVVLDVFQTAYQIAPLDLNTDAFYPQRRERIEARLSLITDDFDAAVKLLRTHHLEQHQVACVGVNWAAFGGEEGLKVLLKVARGIGGMALSVIMRQFAEDYRHNRAGMPDLILWRTCKAGEESHSLITQANEIVFAEVKSPNDRLSDAQRHWISVLKGAGMRVLVVRVLSAERADICGKKRMRSNSQNG